MDGFKPAEGGPHSDVPWWMRYAGKGAGVVGGGCKTAPMEEDPWDNNHSGSCCSCLDCSCSGRVLRVVGGRVHQSVLYRGRIVGDRGGDPGHLHWSSLLLRVPGLCAKVLHVHGRATLVAKSGRLLGVSEIEIPKCSWNSWNTSKPPHRFEIRALRFKQASELGHYVWFWVFNQLTTRAAGIFFSLWSGNPQTFHSEGNERQRCSWLTLGIFHWRYSSKRLEFRLHSEKNIFCALYSTFLAMVGHGHSGCKSGQRLSLFWDIFLHCNFGTKALFTNVNRSIES